jgi:uncharacterized membrane protein
MARLNHGFKAIFDLVRRAVLLLSLIGIGVAGYLTWVHYGHLKIICVSGGGGCEKVQASSYAELAGIPVAVLGLAGYIGIFLGTLLLPGELGKLVGAFLSLVGFGFSLYLTWAELFRIHAICQWCASSAVIMTVLLVLTLTRLLRYDDAAGARSSARDDVATAHSATDAPAAISRR